MQTIAGKFSLVLEDLIVNAMADRRDILANSWSTHDLEMIRLTQGEIAGLRLALEFIEEADRKMRGAEGGI